LKTGTKTSYYRNRDEERTGNLLAFQTIKRFASEIEDKTIAKKLYLVKKGSVIA
jgi:hypothetical protein